MPPNDKESKKDQILEENGAPKGLQGHRESLDILQEMANVLNVHLTKSQLAICTSLIEDGSNPEALAVVVKVLMEEQAEEDAKYKGSA